MNTNETQEYEIPAEWDVTVQAAERRGYRKGLEAGNNRRLLKQIKRLQVDRDKVFNDGIRIGIEKMRDAIMKLEVFSIQGINREAAKLLAEQEKKI